LGRSNLNPTKPSRLGLLLMAFLAMTISGCAQIGPDLIKAGRNDYNKVLAQTDDEEMLSPALWG
jgi:hypothetical protein